MSYIAAVRCVTVLYGAIGAERLAQAQQRPPELWGSVGASMTLTAVQRNPAPSGFRPSGEPHVAAALGLLWPLSAGIGLSFDQRLTGLSPSIRYQYSGRNIRGRSSSGMPPNALVQTGIGLWWLDVLAIGPRWNLDAGLGGSYARSLNQGSGYFLLEGNGQNAAGVGRPLVRGSIQTLRRGTLMLGATTQLQYELSGRQFILLRLEYQRGLHSLTAFRTQQLEYLDDRGIVQQGQLTVSSRGSYGTVQLGYGMRLGSTSHQPVQLRTPRYSTPSLHPEVTPDEEQMPTHSE